MPRDPEEMWDAVSSVVLDPSLSKDECSGRLAPLLAEWTEVCQDDGIDDPAEVANTWNVMVALILQGTRH